MGPPNYPTRCRADGCTNTATHGPEREAIVCWGHAGDWPRAPIHTFMREPGVEVPASWLRRLAQQAEEVGAFTLHAHLSNMADGTTTPGWEFTCAHCGETNPHTRETCPGRPPDA
jgi:hypothetical protein